MPRTRTLADPDERPRITLRVHRGILDHFRARAEQSGGFYQRAMEAALRDHVERETGKPVEDQIAKLVRLEVLRQLAALKRRAT